MKKKINKRGIFFALPIIVVLIVVILLLNGNIKIDFFQKKTQKPEPEIISKATLEKIVKVSDLSTFEATYNGIAKVQNEKKPDKIDYYVSYDAKVKAGIDFEKVDITVDKDNKIIKIKIPKTQILDVNVDIASLDYMFVDDKANTATVSEQAYKKCLEDVENESKEESAIYELADQNAHNVIEALLSPFVEQADEEYQLQIN